MRDDLQNLEISERELQNLTNLPIYDEIPILSNPIKRLLRKSLEKLTGPEGATVVFISLSILVFSYIVVDAFAKLFATWVAIPSWVLLILLTISGFYLTKISLYLIWRERKKTVRANMTPSLEILLTDVDRYNAVIKAIHINDQIEEVGNSGVSIKERNKVIEALQLTKADLVRALKTERILRENSKFIISNTELFTNNLATLTAMQVTEKASEHGRLLNEALQIALDVQHEMKRLQTQG